MATVERETQRRHPQRNQWVDIEPCEERVGNTAREQYLKEGGPQCGGGSAVDTSAQEPLGGCCLYEERIGYYRADNMSREGGSASSEWSILRSSRCNRLLDGRPTSRSPIALPQTQLTKLENVMSVDATLGHAVCNHVQGVAPP